MKILIKDKGVKPRNITSYIKATKNPSTHRLEIKKELINIKKIIKNASKV